MGENPSQPPDKPNYGVLIRGIRNAFYIYFIILFLTFLPWLNPDNGWHSFLRGLDYIGRVWFYLGGGTFIVLVGFVYSWNCIF
ncbi:MAG: hypothetical protein KC917_23315, partial [Candidatus Omnitrophica bacterium]|nr:hypothetical protein [Candidatus Omnitrophota bacterium]